MADIITAPAKKGNKLKAPHIDFTPMVDLGFLLITFFIYTTSMLDPKVIEMEMPDTTQTGPPEEWPMESTLTITPTANHLFGYYKGVFDSKEPIALASKDKLREIILKEVNKAKRLPASFSGKAHRLHILIKPNNDCDYSDLVTLLDEMKIAAVDDVALTDITKEEQETLTERLQTGL